MLFEGEWHSWFCLFFCFQRGSRAKGGSQLDDRVQPWADSFMLEAQQNTETSFHHSTFMKT